MTECADTITHIDVILWLMVVAAFAAGHWFGRKA